MLKGGWRTVSWLAGFAIAAHAILAILAGFMMPAFAAPADPFSVICHSQGTGTPTDPQTDLPGSGPTGPCDHCKLSNAVAAPTAPDSPLAGDLTPANLLQVLYPQSIAPVGGIAITLKLARGPPQRT